MNSNGQLTSRRVTSGCNLVERLKIKLKNSAHYESFNEETSPEGRFVKGVLTLEVMQRNTGRFRFMENRATAISDIDIAAAIKNGTGTIDCTAKC